MSPLDLHVLGTPPAFVLSQDQTLPFNPFKNASQPFGLPRLFYSLESSLSSSFLRVYFLCIVFKVLRPPGESFQILSSELV